MTANLSLKLDLTGLERGESKWAGRRHELVFSPPSKIPDFPFVLWNDSSVFIGEEARVIIGLSIDCGLLIICDDCKTPDLRGPCKELWEEVGSFDIKTEPEAFSKVSLTAIASLVLSCTWDFP